MRAFRLAACVAALFVLSGCEAGVRVGIEANDRGGGRVVATVTLDPEAQAVAGDLKGKLEVDDLTEAGWVVVGPEKVGSDVRVTATKRFVSADGAARAVRELDGSKGLFDDVRISQKRGVLRTTTRFSGVVDLRRGIEAFSDDELAEVLGSPLGATEAEFERRIGSTVSEALPITVRVSLPGDAQSAEGDDDGTAVTWQPKLGERLTLAATAQRWNTPVIVLLATGALALGVAVIVVVSGRRTPSP